MPIRVRCPDCQQSHNLADDLRGKKIRCKKCTNVFAVEDPDERAVPTLEEVVEETPRKRAVTTKPDESRALPRKGSAVRRDRDDEAPPRRRSRRDDEDEDDFRDDPEGEGSGKGLLYGLIGGGAFLVLLLGGLGAWFFLGSSAPPPVATPVPTVALANPNPNPVPNQNPAPNPNPVPNANPVPNPNPNPAPNPQPIPKQNPPFVPPPPAVPAAPVAWSVKVDPGTAVKALADPKGAVPLPVNQPVLYASRFGPFVSIGQNLFDNDSRQVWNLETLKQVGTVTGKLTSREPRRLSPDGKYLVGQANPMGQTVLEVVFTEDGRVAQSIELQKGFALIDLFDFAAADQLVVVKSSGLTKVIQVWSLANGQMVREFAAKDFPFDTKNTTAISPGGRYLATFHSNKITFYDLEKGQIAGETSVALNPGYAPCKGLAFTPDGKTLALIFDSNPRAQVVVLDVAKGKADKPISLPKDIYSLAGGARIYPGPGLQWLPDRSGWLALGFFLIDNPSGRVVYTLPASLEAGFTSPRLLLDKDHLAAVTGTGDARRVQIFPLPREEIDLAAKAARSGQDPATASMPALKPADWAAVRKVPAANGVVDWKVEADPAPAKKTTRQPIPLPVKGQAVNRVVFAAAAGQAAVLSQSGEGGLSDAQQFRVDRFDLGDGSSLGGVDLFRAAKGPNRPAAEMPADLSPAGGFLALVEPGTSRRVDVWSLADKKHLVAWAPLDGDKSQTVRWVGFADEKRLLTLSSGGKLVLWNVADRKAEYAVEGFTGAVALSPGRKYLVGQEAGILTVLDASSGERRGQLKGPAGVNLAACQAYAFRPKGAGLAGLLRTGAGSRLVAWDLKQGDVTADVPTNLYASALEWCGDKHLLLDGTLIDLGLKAPLCNYVLPGAGKHLPGGPDGRHWFAVSPKGDETAKLLAQTLPDPVARNLTAALAKPGAQVLLRPGMKVSVSVEAAGSLANLDNTRGNILTSLKQHFGSAGIEVVDGARVSLRVQMKEQATGEFDEYTQLGRGRRNIKVAVKRVACEAALTAGGAGIWKQAQVFKTGKPIGLLRTDNAQKTLDEMLWQNASSWAYGMGRPPTFIVRVAGKLGALPLTSILSGDR